MANDYKSQDFIDTYQELLEFMKNQTKYDPSTSSEADPGVVLLKLIALLKDKIDFKADMSEAQAYLDTVSDRQAAFDLFQMLGYSMKNAKSATGQILVSLRSEETQSKILPIFSGITDDTDTVSYFTTQEVELVPLSGQSVESVQKIVNVMEGTLFSIEKEGYDVFSLKDIDESGRFFLQKSGLAQNGVFVLDENGKLGDSPWQNLESTNIYPQGKYFFVLSDSTGENYIQFPENFEELIGSSSFTVKVTYTKGSAGNIKMGTLVKTTQDATFYNIRQIADISNGSDEEDIQQATQNYYASQGVFNTLVTKTDFENAIRFLLKDGRRLFSNSFVKTAFDRRIEIVTNSNGKNYKVFKPVIKDDDPQEIEATCLSYGGYNESFTYATDEKIGDNLDLLVNNLLEDSKELLSNVVMTKTGRLLAVTDLIGNVFVNASTPISLEDIKRKLQEKIQERFNAKNETFGQKLDYQVLLDLIKSVDNKISAVTLNSPEYQIYSDYNFESGEVTNLTPDDYTDIQAKAVLSGATPLFKFSNRKNSATDTNTNYLDVPFGSGNYEVISNGGNQVEISNILIKTSDNDPLPENCLLQVSKDSVRADVQYGYGVYYKLFQVYPVNDEITVSNGEKKTIITAGTELVKGSIIIPDGTTLSKELLDSFGEDGKTLKSNYTVKAQINLATNSKLFPGSKIGVGSSITTNGGTTTTDYPALVIEDGQEYTIKNNNEFAIKSSSQPVKSFNVGEKIKPVGLKLVAQSTDDFLSSKILGVSENIEHLVKDSSILPDTYYYFLRLNNKKSLTLKQENGQRDFYILQDNEYFVYSDNALESYVLLSAGTKLSLPKSDNQENLSITFNQVINSKLDETTSSSFVKLPASIEVTATEIQTFKGPKINLQIPEFGSWEVVNGSLEVETVISKEIADDGKITYIYSDPAIFTDSDYVYRVILEISSDSTGVAKISKGIKFNLTVKNGDEIINTYLIGADGLQDGNVRLICSTPFSSVFYNNTKQNFLADNDSASIAKFIDKSIIGEGVNTTNLNGIVTINSTGGTTVQIPVLRQNSKLIQFKVYVKNASGNITISHGTLENTMVKNMNIQTLANTIDLKPGEVATISATSLGTDVNSQIQINNLKNGDEIILSSLAQILDYSDEIKYMKTDNGTLIDKNSNGYFNKAFESISGSNIIKRMLDLDIDKIFDWSALSDGTLSHPTKPESFFSQFHPYNKQVIPYIKKDLSLLKINQNFRS